MSRQPDRPIAVLTLIVAALLLASGCTVGDHREVRWRVREADHTVTADQAIQQATPVIEAVTAAIDRLPGKSEWEAVSAAPNVLDDRCGMNVSKYGTVEIDTIDADDLGATVAASAAPFGYTDFTAELPGGPGVEYVDVADDDTMLRVGSGGSSQAWIEFYVPAHHDQCDWPDFPW